MKRVLRLNQQHAHCHSLSPQPSALLSDPAPCRAPRAIGASADRPPHRRHASGNGSCQRVFAEVGGTPQRGAHRRRQQCVHAHAAVFRFLDAGSTPARPSACLATPYAPQNALRVTRSRSSSTNTTLASSRFAEQRQAGLEQQERRAEVDVQRAQPVSAVRSARAGCRPAKCAAALTMPSRRPNSRSIAVGQLVVVARRRAFQIERIDRRLRAPSAAISS